MEGTTQVSGEKPVEVGGSGVVSLIRKVNRVTQRKFSAEDKIRIVLEGFRKEIPVTDLCRRERIGSAVYYSWLKQFMEGGKARLRGDTLREATKEEVDRLKQETSQWFIVY
ncbi:MAG: transposase [Candidatus Edwardsbacteria bacterium]